MALFSSDNQKEKQHSGILGAFSVDVIKWEPETDAAASVIVHKFEYEDFPNGSYLIVGPAQMAIFTNNMSAGSSSEDAEAGRSQVSTFIGPCKIKLETGDSRFAPFRNVSHKLTGGESAFHSTVYFVNTTYMNELAWGTQSPFIVVDCEEEVNVHVRARGLFGVHIEQTDTGKAVVQARKFLQKVVGTRADYTRNELINYMRAKILEYVPDLLAKNMIERQISVLKITAYLSEFSSTIYEKLIAHFDEFGLTLDNFSFHAIEPLEEDLSAVNEMKIQRKRDQLEAEGAARKMDIESAARARMREREGYTYQQEQSFNVMQAAASNEGTASNVMGAGMGIGMGFGIGGALNNGMGQIAQNAMSSVNLQQPMQAAPAMAGGAGAQGGQIVCPSCNTPNPARAGFCFNCGTKLEKACACPKCGKELLPGAKFCSFCGAPTEKVCPSCGAKLQDGAKFCLECGTQL